MPKFPKPFLILLAALALAALACRAISQAENPPESRPENSPAEPAGAGDLSGEQVFRERGCDQCHNSIAAVAAPSLEGVYGSEIELEGGETVIADEAYLRESILSPGAKIVRGYQPIMPADFSSRLSDEEVEALVRYIRELGD